MHSDKKKGTMCYLTHIQDYKINIVNIGTASKALRRLKIHPNTLWRMWAEKCELRTKFS